MKKIIIIPAYNEEENIERTVNAIQKSAQDFDYVIINDCSIDNTRKICEEKGFNIVNLPINLGIGGAVQTGYKYAYENGYDILGIGEMGIGNTTTSSSVLVSLTGCEIEEAVGKGAGITKEAFEKKKWVVSKAIKINSPNKNDIIDVLSNVGGFDIAGMTGVFLGAAYYKIPVVIDGFISAVAALSAIKLNPLVKEYLIASHYSKEIGYKIAMKEIGLEPMLNLDMRLGEGSGCPIAFSIVEFSCAMMNNMATFDEAGINDDYLDDVREEENYIV